VNRFEFSGGNRTYRGHGYTFSLGRGREAGRAIYCCATAFERLFKERGLPDAIRSDNGIPFASPNGIVQSLNGRHERLPLLLKKEADSPNECQASTANARTKL
jgi:hypothetical protein